MELFNIEAKLQKYFSKEKKWYEYNSDLSGLSMLQLRATH